MYTLHFFPELVCFAGNYKPKCLERLGLEYPGLHETSP
jgi:hypothetical protein